MSFRGDGDECAVGQSEAPVMVLSMVQFLGLFLELRLMLH